MVKVKTISRDSRDYVKTNSGDLTPVLKNPAPVLHPFDKNREYQKATNAEKLNQIFAKPFAFNLEGHMDGIFSMRRHPTFIKTVASGSCDGGTFFFISFDVKNEDLSTCKSLFFSF